MGKEIVKREVVVPETAIIREFFTPVDLDAKLDAGGISDVLGKLHVAGRMVGVITTQFVVQGGQWLLLLKRNMPHGEWGPFCQRHFPDLPKRTRCHWMAEARYFLEHGHRKSVAIALLGASGGTFEGDGDEDLDEDEVADPKKPAPRPRKELESEVSRLERRLAARDKREESLLKRIDGLETRLDRESKARDPDEAGGNPIRDAMAKAVLSTGRAVVLLREAETEDVVAELRDGAAASLSSRLQTAAQDVANELYRVFHKAFPGKPWKGPEPSEE